MIRTTPLPYSLDDEGTTVQYTMNCARCGWGTAQIKVYIMNTLAYSVMHNATDITEFPITESLAVKTLYVTFCKPSMK
jgi:hypothetical protein